MKLELWASVRREERGDISWNRKIDGDGNCVSASVAATAAAAAAASSNEILRPIIKSSHKSFGESDAVSDWPTAIRRRRGLTAPTDSCGQFQWFGCVAMGDAENTGVEFAALNGYGKTLKNLKSTQRLNTMLLMARTSRLLSSLQSDL